MRGGYGRGNLCRLFQETGSLCPGGSEDVKVLVIGGTGTIGSFVTQELWKRGYEITLLVRGLSRQVFPNELETSVVHGDRRDVSLLRTIAEHNFDVVVDLACYEPQDAETAVQTFSGKIEQYLFVSTVDVYTKPAAVYPVTEDAERNPRKSFAYAWKKAQCEEVFFKAHREKRCAVTIIRPAHTYCEGVTPLLQVFGWTTDHLDRIRKGKPVMLHGDGTSLWSSLYAEDLAIPLARALLNPVAYGKAYNIASEEIMCWNRLYEIVADVMGVPLCPVYVPARVLGQVFPEKALWCVENFQYSNVFSVALAKKDLGFATRTSYRDGVTRCLRWFAENGGFDNSDSPRFDFYERFLKVWETSMRSLTETLVRDTGSVG
uniref:NAD-dependent epimerase/dehydratase family protein n=1 Tax=Candidatus Caldatribacterium californiense TaxID=1454726 RepID=A0A7V3YN02_9BACT